MHDNPHEMQGTLIEQLSTRRNAMTLKEFAALLSISYKTAFELVTRGRVPAFQIGSVWRLDPVELIIWLKEQQRPADGGVRTKIEQSPSGSRMDPTVRSERKDGPKIPKKQQLPNVELSSVDSRDLHPRVVKRKASRYDPKADLPDLNAIRGRADRQLNLDSGANRKSVGEI